MLFMHRLMLPLAKWLLSFTPPPGVVVVEGVPFADPLLQSLMPLLVGLYNVMWLYPAYIISFIFNSVWYQEIAGQAYAITATESVPPPAPSREGFGASLGEELFRVILFAVFMAQMMLTSYVPVLGKPLYVLQLSWMYAYYCFDYKWSLAKWPLDSRLHFVESNWAYFAGFGGPCTMAVVLLPKFVGEGVMSTLFPLFVLVAIGVNANPEEFESRLSLGRLPVFRMAASQTAAIIRFLEPTSKR
jgi:etoposide-induced 2.4 mRNA